MKRDKEYFIRKITELSVKEHGGKCTSAIDVATLLNGYSHGEQEYFLAVTLNGALKVIKVHEVHKGGLGKCIVEPRSIFRACVQDNASSVIVAHNHPSGNLEPSSEDKEITKRLKDCGELLGIPVLDHLILARGEHLSFNMHNLM